MGKLHTDLGKSSVLNLQLYEGYIKVVISIPISVFFLSITAHKVFLKTFLWAIRMKICLFEIWINLQGT